MADTSQTTLPVLGATVRLKANAKRYRGGNATVLRYEEQRCGRNGSRKMLIVNCQGRVIAVALGELESANAK